MTVSTREKKMYSKCVTLALDMNIRWLTDAVDIFVGAIDWRAQAKFQLVPVNVCLLIPPGEVLERALVELTRAPHCLVQHTNYY